ncbi:MAG TPA: BON domain-containing protein [Blastocatellia bacterium]|nr:BON domain-containing protein [Blastocatellia bacterium]
MIATKVDNEIEQEITSELEWELGAEAENVGVHSHAGITTLTGNVRSYAAKIAAQEAALRVSGVTDVANELTVRVAPPLDRSDAEIAKAVRNALEWHVMVPDDRITSTVSDGFVTLRGSVELLTERHEAESTVRSLAGIRGVHNEIEVLPRKVDADELQFKIERALERRAEREANRIAVTVHDGRVMLTGSVQSLAEKRSILGLVSHAHGVGAVDDFLTIKRL